MRLSCLAIALLLFLVACTPNVSPSDEPIPSPQPGNSVEPSPSSQPDNSAEPSHRITYTFSPAPASQHYPDNTAYVFPDSLQFLGNESESIEKKHLLVLENGDLAFYQIWIDFIDDVLEGKDVILPIDVIHNKQVEHPGVEDNYEYVAQHQIAVDGGVATWTDDADKQKNCSGLLDYVYIPDSGEHEIRIDGAVVFTFIYFPPDYERFPARYGFIPLADLPREYSIKQAIKDGCIVVDGDYVYNADTLNTAYDTEFELGYGPFFRVYFNTEDGVIISDYSCEAAHNRSFINADYSRLHANPILELKKSIYEHTFLSSGVSTDNKMYSLYLAGDFPISDIPNGIVFLDLIGK